MGCGITSTWAAGCGRGTAKPESGLWTRPASDGISCRVISYPFNNPLLSQTDMLGRRNSVRCMAPSKIPMETSPVQERFAVIYVVEWMGSPRERYFPTLEVTLNFANRITTDGTTAYPDVATIVRMTRAHEHCAWEEDQSFEVIKVSGRKHPPRLGHSALLDHALGARIAQQRLAG